MYYSVLVDSDTYKFVMRNVTHYFYLCCVFSSLPRVRETTLSCADTMSFAGLAPEIINGRAAMLGAYSTDKICPISQVLTYLSPRYNAS